MELALKMDQSLLKERAIRVSRCKKNPKPFKPEDDKTSAKENGKEAGAYKRIKHKQGQQERQKGAGWISKMKQRNKESRHNQPKVSSFAGETTGANTVKVLVNFIFIFFYILKCSFFTRLSKRAKMSNGRKRN